MKHVWFPVILSFVLTHSWESVYQWTLTQGKVVSVILLLATPVACPYGRSVRSFLRVRSYVFSVLFFVSSYSRRSVFVRLWSSVFSFFRWLVRPFFFFLLVFLLFSCLIVPTSNVAVWNVAMNNVATLRWKLMTERLKTVWQNMQIWHLLNCKQADIATADHVPLQRKIYKNHVSSIIWAVKTSREHRSIVFNGCFLKTRFTRYLEIFIPHWNVTRHNGWIIIDQNLRVAFLVVDTRNIMWSAKTALWSFFYYIWYVFRLNCRIPCHSK